MKDWKVRKVLFVFNDEAKDTISRVHRLLGGQILEDGRTMAYNISIDDQKRTHPLYIGQLHDLGVALDEPKPDKEPTEAEVALYPVPSGERRNIHRIYHVKKHTR